MTSETTMEGKVNLRAMIRSLVPPGLNQSEIELKIMHAIRQNPQTNKLIVREPTGIYCTEQDAHKLHAEISFAITDYVITRMNNIARKVNSQYAKLKKQTAQNNITSAERKPRIKSKALFYEGYSSLEGALLFLRNNHGIEISANDFLKLEVAQKTQQGYIVSKESLDQALELEVFAVEENAVFNKGLQKYLVTINGKTGISKYYYRCFACRKNSKVKQLTNPAKAQDFYNIQYNPQEHNPKNEKEAQK